jgi:hypothetical protein
MPLPYHQRTAILNAIEAALPEAEAGAFRTGRTKLLTFDAPDAVAFHATIVAETARWPIPPSGVNFHGQTRSVKARVRLLRSLAAKVAAFDIEGAFAL